MSEQINKTFWGSRTVWIGIMEIIAGIITAVAGELSTGATVSVMGILMIIMRTVTNSPIAKG